MFSLNDHALRANCHIIPINSCGDLPFKLSLPSDSRSDLFLINILRISPLLLLIISQSNSDAAYRNIVEMPPIGFAHKVGPHHIMLSASYAGHTPNSGPFDFMGKPPPISIIDPIRTNPPTTAPMSLECGALTTMAGLTFELDKSENEYFTKITSFFK